MYTPGFFDMFLLLVGVAVWTRYLMTFRGAPTWVHWVPWGSGLLLVVGQLWATAAVIAPPGTPGASDQVDLGRWISVGGIAVGVSLLVVASGIVARRRAT